MINLIIQRFMWMVNLTNSQNPGDFSPEPTLETAGLSFREKDKLCVTD